MSAMLYIFLGTMRKHYPASLTFPDDSTYSIPNIQMTFLLRFNIYIYIYIYLFIYLFIYLYSVFSAFINIQCTEVHISAILLLFLGSFINQQNKLNVNMNTRCGVFYKI